MDDTTDVPPGQSMAGGRTFGAVRVGDTVHRRAHPWTPAVHALLRHLERADFAGAPRVVGHDDRGREVLTYLHGEVAGELPWPPWVYSDLALIQVGRWLRQLHDATATFVPPPDAAWFAGQRWRPGLITGHHDAAPYNAVWRTDRLVGFVDWDTAGPSSRELDLAFTALSWVPLSARRVAEQLGYRAFDDRSRRLHLLLDAYGYQDDRHQFAAVVSGRARMHAAAIRASAATGDPVYVALLPGADDMAEAAQEIEALPAAFWTNAGVPTLDGHERACRTAPMTSVDP